MNMEKIGTKIRSLVTILILVMMNVVVRAEIKPIPSPYPVHERYNAELGRSDALQLVGEGKLTLLAAGLPPKCESMIRMKLYAKAGISWEVIGDVTSSDFEDYRGAFNEVVVQHVKRKKGHDFFVRLDKRINKHIKHSCSAQK